MVDLRHRLTKSRKYGTVDQQLRALTVLDGLIENAGPRFQRAFADEPLLERLRVCATDSLSDADVKRKCSILFEQWEASYKETPGMGRLAALNRQLPKRKKPVTQAQSKVLRETEPSPNDDPFSNDESEPSTPAVASPSRPTFNPSSSNVSSGSGFASSFRSSARKDKKTKTGKGVKPKAFNIEKEKPEILQTIASSSIASTNLMNALKLIDRQHKRVSEDTETLKRFEVCKGLRRQILHYIQHIESEQWLGSLINANDGLVEALMAFEVLDKSIDDDSDSDGGGLINDDEHPPAMPARPTVHQPKSSISRDLAGMSLGNLPPAQPPTVILSGESGPSYEADSGSDDPDDEDDPFGDSNAVHTPKAERPGMTW